MERLAGIFIVLIALSAFFWLIESLFAAHPQQPRMHRRAGFWTDLAYWFTTPLLTRSVTRVGLVLILVLVYRESPADIRALLLDRSTGLARQPLWLQAIEMLVVGDLVAYWMHRWFHARRLWPFHAVHHSSTELDWLSSVRVHPVNEWLTRWVQVSVLVVLGFNPLAIALYVPFLTFFGIFIHANVPWGFGWLGYVIASPRFHRWHHTSQAEGRDRNFAGVFPVFDVIFGTYYMPRDRLPEKFGVEGDPVPEGFLGQLAYPFRRGKDATGEPRPA
jgi:sterol desaturase/sphingolipid hydroxylase (fatty acid hydroxylase superfamily)